MTSVRPQARSVPSFTSTTTTSKPTQQQVSLARRLLFPSLPASVTDLPPLLATPSPELTAELYDFLALALRAFVNPWWTKITRYDKQFLPEITRVLTVVVRALEARLVAADLSPLVFRDLPELVTQHYKDYRNAASKLSTSYAAGGSVPLPRLFHQLQPHIAVSSEGKIDEVYVRQAVDHVLKSCLPPEDYEPEVERSIIREIIMKVLLQDVVPKITQSWFIHKTILDLLDPTDDKRDSSMPSGSSTPVSPPALSATASPFSFHTVLVAFLSAVQTVSGICLALIHAYKHALSTIKLVNHSTVPHGHSHAQSSHEPPLASASSSTTSLPIPPPARTSFSANDYAGPSVMMLTEIFTINDRHASSAIANSVSILTALFTTFLDRLLPHLLYTHLLSLASITYTVRIAKRALFPNGYPAPPPPDPSPDEQFAIRETLVRTIVEKTPPFFSALFLGPTPSVALNAALDPLSSPACNTHLVMLLLDVIILTLFPEMGIEGKSSEGEREGKPNGMALASGQMSRSVSITPPGSIPPLP